ncbi:MAG: aminotransferase class V-fold PLP-dependent enzyme [Thermaerobacter sp.]|nr:aminotransferase class V-fold PLP-dependent enzyme [Thermaerobacter sp.]
MYGKDLRLLIPAARDLTYLNTGTLGPTPVTALAASSAGEMEWEERGPGHLPHYLNARTKARHFAQRIETQWSGGMVSLTANNSESLLRVLWGIDFQAGDEIITTSHEHSALVMGLSSLARRFHIKIHVVPVDDPLGLTDHIRQVLSSRTRLVAMSHVSHLTGWTLPVADVRQLLSSFARCRLLVDGAQALGNIVVNPEQLGADYYVFCGHKWMMAPAGWAGLWVRTGCGEELFTAWPDEQEAGEAARLAQGPVGPSARGGEAFEYGTRGWPRVAGWSVTWDYYEEEGFAHHAEYQQALADEARQRLARLPGIQVLMTPNPSLQDTALMTAMSDKAGSGIVDWLWSREIIVKPVPSYHGIRISWALFNTEDDLDALESALVMFHREF